MRSRKHEIKVRLNDAEFDRLNDMVESIREHGVLNPVIVRKMHYGYEMLSGHNRQNAAKLAGLKQRAAGMVISYMVMGDKMKQTEVENVREIIRNARNNEDDSLPEIIR